MPALPELDDFVNCWGAPETLNKLPGADKCSPVLISAGIQILDLKYSEMLEEFELKEAQAIWLRSLGRLSF